MNEVKKTGLFWVAAGITAAIAAVIAWPTSSRDEGGVSAQINKDLFAEFKDPLAAASMKIVSFDEAQGKLGMFEVRKDRESGVWTIPSRDGYPADAVEQMKDAANSLVGLKILDIQTENAEDHDDLGVVEPKLEDLEVGDTGVGRLVTLKDESQTTLASLVIGDPVKDREGQRYVRRPGQDPVYVVALDDAPLTTQFSSWIEDDLLQMSSIDIEDVEIKDYNASLSLGGFSLSRNYTAKLSMDGSQWALEDLLDYDGDGPAAEPTPVVLKPEEELNSSKLNDLKNALDDLKIVDVVRKPKGMSENLRADKELVSDNEAVASLAQRGFYPASSGGGEVEILSANGELLVGLNDGVQYLMRFGNVAGLGDEEDGSDDDDGESETSGGVNRYLLVTTQVDESKFPPPDLKAVPQSLKELEALLSPKEEAAEAETQVEPEPPAKEDETATEEANEDKKMKSDKDSKDAEGGQEDSKADDESKADDSKAEDSEADAKKKPNKKDADADDKSAKGNEDKPKKAKKADAGEVDAGEVDAEGAGEASVSGGAQEDDDTDEDSVEESSEEDSEPGDNDASDDSEKEVSSEQESDAAEDTSTKGDDSSADAGDAVNTSEPVNELADMTEEEKQERLEAEQEKITKDNQRKLDERKDKIDAAKKRVSELNARFADWYYVIPEDTYSKLHIQRSELVKAKEEAQPQGGMPPGGFPPGAMPPGGLPPGFGN